MSGNNLRFARVFSVSLIYSLKSGIKGERETSSNMEALV